MLIRNTLRPESGTLINSGFSPEETSIAEIPACVTNLDKVALIELTSLETIQSPRIASRVLDILDKLSIGVHLATQASQGQVHAIVIAADRSVEALQNLNSEFAAELDRGVMDPIACNIDVTLVSVVMDDLHKSTARVMSTFTLALAEVGVDVLMLGQGPRTISCAVNGASTTNAVAALHTAFNLSGQVSIMMLAGATTHAETLTQQDSRPWGAPLVAPYVLKLLEQQACTLKSKMGLSTRVIGLWTPSASGLLWNEAGVDNAECTAYLEQDSGEQSRLPDVTLLQLDRFARQPSPILVDSSACVGRVMEEVYTEAIKRGISVVVCNARSLQHLSQEFVDAHCGLTSAPSPAYFACASTVGGSVPIISTVHQLMRTGDQVLDIDCALSGSMNYVTNELVSGVTIAAAVRTAYENRLTEEQPQEDFCGTDMARRLVVMAQQLGHTITLNDVQCEPMMPIPDADVAGNAEQMLEALRAYQPTYDKEKEEHPGERLRYVGKLNVTDGKVQCFVKPQWVAKDSEMYRMRGTEIFMSIATESTQRVLVQGAGLGGNNGAVGVVRDILAIATRLHKNSTMYV